MTSLDMQVQDTLVAISTNTADKTSIKSKPEWEILQSIQARPKVVLPSPLVPKTDPPEPHHIPACLPQLHTGHTPHNTPGKSRSHLRRWPVHSSSPHVLHVHRGIGNWDWSRDFSWLWIYRNKITSWMSSSYQPPVVSWEGRIVLNWSRGGGGQGYLSSKNFRSYYLYLELLQTLKSSATARKKLSSWTLRDEVKKTAHPSGKGEGSGEDCNKEYFGRMDCKPRESLYAHGFAHLHKPKWHHRSPCYPPSFIITASGHQPITALNLTEPCIAQWNWPG